MPDASTIWLAVYLIVGPLLWTGMLAVTYAQRRSRRHGEAAVADLPQPAPRASIIIPVRNEAEQIAAHVRAALAQHYDDFEVVVVDDRSTDGTSQIVDELAACDARLRVIHITPDDFPQGWMGKNYAVARGARSASGEWLLFVDSDVLLEPPALRELVRRGIGHNTPLSSVTGAVEGGNFWERLIVPVAGWVAAFVDTVVREPVVHGWTVLVRRDVYEEVGGHEAVRNIVGEDLALAKLVGERGYRTRVWWGTHLATIRMNRSLGEIIRGIARNFYAISPPPIPKRTLIGLAVVAVLCLPVFGILGYALAHGMVGLTITTLLHVAIMVWLFGTTYRWTGNPASLALLLPFTLLLMVAMFLRSLWMTLTGNVNWRGTGVTVTAVTAPAPRPSSPAVHEGG